MIDTLRDIRDGDVIRIRENGDVHSISIEEHVDEEPSTDGPGKIVLRGTTDDGHGWHVVVRYRHRGISGFRAGLTVIKRTKAPNATKPDAWEYVGGEIDV